MCDIKEERAGGFITVQPYESPCGTLRLGAYDGRLCLCDWDAERRDKRMDRRLQRGLNAEFMPGTCPTIERAAEELDEYFTGRRQDFDIPLLFVGTDFQRLVWRSLLRIPYGKTVSYSGMAQLIGMPRAVRAVANANAANAISIFAPCHRVIGSNGTLTGYGGGLTAKRMLLALEMGEQTFRI